MIDAEKKLNKNIEKRTGNRRSRERKMEELADGSMRAALDTKE